MAADSSNIPKMAGWAQYVMSIPSGSTSLNPASPEILLPSIPPSLAPLSVPEAQECKPALVLDSRTRLDHEPTTPHRDVLTQVPRRVQRPRDSLDATPVVDDLRLDSPPFDPPTLAWVGGVDSVAKRIGKKKITNFALQQAVSAQVKPPPTH